MEKIFSDQVFERTEMDPQKLVAAEYDHCVFRHINFNAVDMSGSLFIDCQFEECDLSLIKVHNTVFRDVQFVNCKMMGIHFENCNKFGLSITINNCLLQSSSFY